MPEDLQDAVDELALRLGRPVLLEDQVQRVVAYSEQTEPMDDVRRETILRRHTTPEVRRWFRSAGIFEAAGPLRIPGAAGLGLLPRVCVPTRHDGRLLGFLWLIARSPFGRLVRAIREDDVVAATLGKNVLWARVRIFAIGGAIIGLAGSMHSIYYQYIDPTQFTNIVIAYAFMAVIAGGRGAHLGTIGGAAAVMLLLEGSRVIKDAIPALDSDQLAAIRIIIIGAGLIALLVWKPQGFLQEFRLKAGRENA